MDVTDDLVPTSAVPAPPESHLPPPPPPHRRRRRWPWIAGAGAVLVLIAGVALVALDETVLTHDLVHARFTTDARPFSTGASSDYSFALVDGTYRVTATTGTAVPVESFGGFARRAYQTEVSLTVVDARSMGANGAVGIGCYDRPSTSGYALGVSDAGYAIVRADPNSHEVIAAVDRAVTWSTAPVRLTIACGATSVGGDVVEIRGLVDGVEVVTATDASGITSYDAAVVLFHSDTAGAWVAIDDVDARVPGS